MTARNATYEVQPTCLNQVIYLIFWMCFIGVATSPSQTRTDAPTARRSFSVSDAVETVQAQAFLDASPLAHYSPDRKRLVVAVRRGNLEKNTNDYSLLLWRTRDLFSSAKYEVLVRMSSSSNRPAIERILWLDNETLAFLGENPNEVHQLYTVNVHTRKRIKITDSSRNIWAYAFSADRRKIVYAKEEASRPIFEGEALKRGYFAEATDHLWELIKQEKDASQLSDKLYVADVGGRYPARVITLLQGSRGFFDWTNPAISPDGNYIVVKVYVTKPSTDWEQYADPTLQKYLQYAWPSGDSYLESYELIDIKTGRSRLLLNSPVLPNHQSEPLWLPDSSSVIVSNMLLPLAGVDEKERERRRNSAFVVEVPVAGEQVVNVASEDLRLLRFDKTTGCLQASNHTLFILGSLDSAKKNDGMIRCFRRRSATWEEDLAVAQGLATAEIMWKQELNSAPKLVAIQPDNRQVAQLLDPNPQYDHLTFGRVEEVRWKASDGQEIRGGLIYPVDFSPGQKYPLVIQTHGWVPKKFIVDGLYTTAFAAQALANKGMLVLQADWRVDNMGVVGEGNGEQANYQGAIDYLDSRGMIDRRRVGIIGFSRTCYHVKYMVTHSNYPIAVASVTDGFDFGYFQYMGFTGWLTMTTSTETLNGGRPFGEGIKSWAENSPEFRLDRVRTPFLITAPFRSSVLSEWGWYAGLRHLGKPVEFLLLQDGVHELEKPMDRMTSAQTNVDWFDFWLNGHEDPDPTKAEQYKRWRELRKLQELNDGKTVE